MLGKQNQNRGFTLVELMIVIAILGVLAAVAIPNFNQYQARSRTGEAKANLAAIRTAELAYVGEFGSFPGSGQGSDIPHPFFGSADVNFPGTQKQNWKAATGSICNVGIPGCFFEQLNWTPEGPVFYDYGVVSEMGPNGPRFVAYAMGDVDGDAAAGGGLAVFAFVYPDSLENYDVTICDACAPAGEAPRDPASNAPLLKTVAQYLVTQGSGGYDDY